MPTAKRKGRRNKSSGMSVYIDELQNCNSIQIKAIKNFFTNYKYTKDFKVVEGKALGCFLPANIKSSRANTTGLSAFSASEPKANLLTLASSCTHFLIKENNSYAVLGLKGFADKTSTKTEVDFKLLRIKDFAKVRIKSIEESIQNLGDAKTKEWAIKQNKLYTLKDFSLEITSKRLTPTVVIATPEGFTEFLISDLELVYDFDIEGILNKYTINKTQTFNDILISGAYLKLKEDVNKDLKADTLIRFVGHCTTALGKNHKLINVVSSKINTSNTERVYSITRGLIDQKASLALLENKSITPIKVSPKAVENAVRITTTIDALEYADPENTTPIASDEEMFNYSGRLRNLNLFAGVNGSWRMFSCDEGLDITRDCMNNAILVLSTTSLCKTRVQVFAPSENNGRLSHLIVRVACPTTRQIAFISAAKFGTVFSTRDQFMRALSYGIIQFQLPPAYTNENHILACLVTPIISSNITNGATIAHPFLIVLPDNKPHSVNISDYIDNPTMTGGGSLRRLFIYRKPVGSFINALRLNDLGMISHNTSTRQEFLGAVRANANNYMLHMRTLIDERQRQARELLDEAEPSGLRRQIVNHVREYNATYDFAGEPGFHVTNAVMYGGSDDDARNAELSDLDMLEEDSDG